jgi:hypothetical protein
MTHPLAGRTPRAPRRRLLAGALAGAFAGAALAGCDAPGVREAARGAATALRPPAAARDRATVFQSLLRGDPVVSLAAPNSPWQASAEPPATVEATPDGIRVVSEPGRVAWVSPRLPLAPLLEHAPGQVEELTWEATLTLAPTRRFFVVCEVRFAGEPGALLIQATPFDLQVTQDAARPGGGTSQSVSRLVGDGTPHFWRLRLDGARVELRLDGSTVWALEGGRALARVAFGETRTDALHGGTMLLRDVVYVRRPG